MNSRKAFLIGAFCALLTLPIAASPKERELDLTQPYVLLSGKKAKKLQQNLDRAAAVGYRIVHAGPRRYYGRSFEPGLLGGFHYNAGEYLVLLEKLPATEQAYQYLVLEGGSDKKLEGRINEAAQEGFLLLPGTLAYKSWHVGFFGGHGTLFGLMEKAPEPAQEMEYRVLERVLTGRLSRDIEEAVAEGYVVLQMVEGGGYTVVMQRAITKSAVPASATSAAPKKEYLLLSTNKRATMRKELQEATADGEYAVVGASDTMENLVLLEKVSTPPPVEYTVVGPKKKEMREARAQGYEPFQSIAWQRPKGVTSASESPTDRNVIEGKKIADLEKQILDAVERGYQPVTIFIWEKPEAVQSPPP